MAGYSGKSRLDVFASTAQRDLPVSRRCSVQPEEHRLTVSLPLYPQHLIPAALQLVFYTLNSPAIALAVKYLAYCGDVARWLLAPCVIDELAR